MALAYLEQVGILHNYTLDSKKTKKGVKFMMYNSHPISEEHTRQNLHQERLLKYAQLPAIQNSFCRDKNMPHLIYQMLLFITFLFCAMF